jgi:hypothetical protein
VDRKLIDAALASGPDAVAALLEAQAARIAALTAVVEELKRLLGRNSGNSSLPPSRDSSAARKQRPKKKGSGRKQGGQPGASGASSSDGRRSRPGHRSLAGRVRRLWARVG